MDESNPTLLRPPPADPAKASIENVLEITRTPVIGPDIFTNTRKQWNPPGARGVFGGSMLGQCLAAGHKTVPDGFLAHSCHSYFLLAGSADTPTLFHVERVRDGRSFATRTVTARQNGAIIFTMTVSFIRSGDSPSPVDTISDNPASPVAGTAEVPPTEEEMARLEGRSEKTATHPFQSYGMRIVGDGLPPAARKVRQWIRARGVIDGGAPAHIQTLGYMSDSYFLATVLRVNNFGAWGHTHNDVEIMSDQEAKLKHPPAGIKGAEGGEAAAAAAVPAGWKEVAALRNQKKKLGMLVSLDHTIFFHHPDRIRADQWMMCEMDSPWSGDDRAIVTQRLWAQDGTLLATCFQEGLVRLSDKTPKSKLA